MSCSRATQRYYPPRFPYLILSYLILSSPSPLLFVRAGDASGSLQRPIHAGKSCIEANTHIHAHTYLHTQTHTKANMRSHPAEGAPSSPHPFSSSKKPSSPFSVSYSLVRTTYISSFFYHAIFSICFLHSAAHTEFDNIAPFSTLQHCCTLIPTLSPPTPLPFPPFSSPLLSS